MDKGMRYLSHYILDIVPYLKVYTKAYPMDTLCIPNREPVQNFINSVIPALYGIPF